MPSANNRNQQPETSSTTTPATSAATATSTTSPAPSSALAGELVEAPRNHERSFCCGAGGGLAFLGEETGERVSHNRAAELVATGAHTIATACPFCNTMFRDALAATGEGAPQLLDIAQLVARGLPERAGLMTDKSDVKYNKFAKKRGNFPNELEQVSSIAEQLRGYMATELVCSRIRDVHKLNGSSQQIQGLLEMKLSELDFKSEKNELFTGCKVPSLRPDFYRKVGKSGILVEIERAQDDCKQHGPLRHLEMPPVRRGGFFVLNRPLREKES